MRGGNRASSAKLLFLDGELNGEVGALQPLLDVRSDWFLLDASVELAERERHLFTVLHRTPEGAVAVFRSEGEL